MKKQSLDDYIILDGKDYKSLVRFFFFIYLINASSRFCQKRNSRNGNRKNVKRACVLAIYLSIHNKTTMTSLIANQKHWRFDNDAYWHFCLKSNREVKELVYFGLSFFIFYFYFFSIFNTYIFKKKKNNEWEWNCDESFTNDETFKSTLRMLYQNSEHHFWIF